MIVHHCIHLFEVYYSTVPRYGIQINYSHNRTTNHPTPKTHQTTLTQSDPSDTKSLDGELYPRERLKNKVLPMLLHKFRVPVTSHTPLWPLRLHLPADTVPPIRIELQIPPTSSNSVHSSSSHTAHLPTKRQKLSKKEREWPLAAKNHLYTRAQRSRI
ncbi:uncharacterized protein BDV14DRAFT_172936 [Aspergillus stella-maris]|uniref:uncharacterized protein n=1 Tax=Aspergillus stella-maris TaxID=1810926 RepID=UPI003CCD8343